MTIICELYLSSLARLTSIVLGPLETSPAMILDIQRNRNGNEDTLY